MLAHGFINEGADDNDDYPSEVLELAAERRENATLLGVQG